jgi:hypothetical protein
MLGSRAGIRHNLAPVCVQAFLAPRAISRTPDAQSSGRVAKEEISLKPPVVEIK